MATLPRHERLFALTPDFEAFASKRFDSPRTFIAILLAP